MKTQMDKVILIFYFNRKGFSESPEDYNREIDIIKKTILKNDEALSYFFVGHDLETRVECLNPKLIDGTEYKKIQEILDKNQKIMNDILIKFKDDEK